MTDREKLIELIGQVQYLGGLELALADHLVANGVTFAKDINVPSWIPVSERLPKAHELVLCRWIRVGYGGRYGFATYQHHNVWYVSNEGMPEVTHWMPLPEPPEKQK